MTNNAYILNIIEGKADEETIALIERVFVIKRKCPCCGETVLFDRDWASMNKMPETSYYFVKCDDCGVPFWVNEDFNPIYYYDNEKISELGGEMNE